MYFRTFALGANTEKLIEKAGFCANSFKEIKSYLGIDVEKTSIKPKDYLYDGSLWEYFDVSNFSERLVLLYRIPMLPFDELWKLYLTGDKEDGFGALCAMAKNHASEMITEIQSNTQSSNKVFRRKLLELKKSPIIANCLHNYQIVSTINGVLDDK